MTQRFFILGAAGSMGRRHAANLKTLRPEAEIFLVDPLLPEADGVAAWRRWSQMPPGHVTGVIIASPTELHLAHMLLALGQGWPVLVEKPLVSWRDVPAWKAALPLVPIDAWARSGVGYSYRFHPAAMGLPAEVNELVFTAWDDLQRRYGPTCADTMASHAIDLAIHRLGRVEQHSLHETADGKRVFGWLRHAGGKISRYSVDMSFGPRFSAIDYQSNGLAGPRVALEPNESMYLSELAAWLALVEHAGPDEPLPAGAERLASLAEGLLASEVIAAINTPAEAGR